MDDTYQINVAKTEFREAYNRGSRGQDRETLRRSLKSGGSQLPATDCQVTTLTQKAT